MPIANIIRERRRELGLTQEQVARSLGVSAPAVNKWERGASYPDITIIPPLARLLQTDANTLLSFEADLDEETNLAIQREVDRLVREEGYVEGFAYAQEQLRLYPASDELAIVLTQYLDGALTLFQVEDPDRYRPALDKAYERLSQSALPEAREQACGMLIARAMQDGRYEDAQHLLDTIHQPQIDKEERQAILLMRQGRDEEAARRWEAPPHQDFCRSHGRHQQHYRDSLARGPSGRCARVRPPRASDVRGARPAWVDEACTQLDRCGGKTGCGRDT